MDDPKIPDAMPEELPTAGGDEGASQSPYKNLLVPLIVVPAMIVMVLVLVWVLFGSLAGSEKGPMENLERMVEGGSNQGDQAAQQLVSQIYEYLKATSEGREPEWELDASFLPAVQRAWEDTDAGDVEHRYVLAFFQRQLGDPAGFDHLLELMALDDNLDEGAEIRFLSAYALGVLAPAYDANERLLAARRLTQVVEGSDAGMRIVAIGGLGRIAEVAADDDTPAAEEAAAALRGALGASRLDVRGSAAIALARLGDPAGAGVLAELIGPEAYAAERAQAPDRWYRADQISQSRIRAVQALAELGRPEDLAVLRAAEAEESDENVLAEIREALREEPTE